jgi:citronellol/citronellal dehydrogenase
MRLANKVAIITGSSRGIGKAIALAFAREGAKIVVAARTEQMKDPRLPGTIHHTVDEIRARGAAAMAVRCDISVEEDVERMMQETLNAFGQVDILVNNAAILFPTPFLQLPFKHWNIMMKVNMNGLFLCTKAVLPHMVERRQGNILNITSDVPNMASKGVALGYGATKAAMNLLTQGLAVQLKEYNIAVNAMNPGPIKSEGAMFAMPNNDWTGWHEPAFVGPPAVFLASQDAHGVTGQVVNAEEFGKTWGPA